MSAYITQYCTTHGEWDMDVDNVSECPACEEAGLLPIQKLRKQNAALIEALEVISEAIKDGDGGSYWPARKYLDQRGIYNGDLNDLRVLDAVAKAALAAVKE